MKDLFRIVLSAAVVAAMTLACKKTQPEPKKDTTFVLEATVSGEAKYDGSGDLSYTVKSIKKIDKKEEFMPWSMEFSMDGGNTWKAEKPEFLTLTTKEENGDLTAKSYNAKFTVQEKTIVNNSADILKAREVKTNVDLSMVDVKGNAHGKGTTTANCYVIHNPGTYKFPTVYGNSRKNGADNPASYTSSKTSTNILKKFIKADGNAIDKPEIEGIANACLIWQDTKDLISEIKYDAATKYVSFKVDKSTIHNGNAIIAVRDASNTILWSWHIWVTEEDLTPVEITNHQGVNYNILPVNLGWCGMNSEVYAQREVKVRIKQTKGNKTQEITFTQKEHNVVVSGNVGNNTFYQWGRKDPMLPSNGIGNTDKSCYPGESQYQFAYKGHGQPLNTTEIKEYIKNPHKFNTKYEMDNKYYNLWNVDNERIDENDDKVIKSVYDPCPVGYTVAPVRAFTGFTTTGSNTYTSSEWNVNGGFNNGWLFYGKSNKSGSTVFFPATGRRDNSTGSLNYVSTLGYCWVAGPYSTVNGRYLSFFSGNVSPLVNYNRSFGFAVRPAQEQ